MASVRSRNILRDAVILFLGVLAATWLLDSIEVESATTLLVVAMVLTLLNMVVKPLLVLFTLPFVILTMGLGVLLINAVLLFLAGQLVPGFFVPTFGTAFLGSLIISLVSLTVNLFLSPRPNLRVHWSSSQSRRTRRSIKKDDVIDV
ncbi:MAG: phage holin family protein [Oceanipulchritudo sp.]|jgi:putative membrane protein